MAEPTTTAAATLVAAPPALAALSIAGVNLGLHPAVLVAGFAGALVAIVLLGSVPAEGDTWPHLLRTTIKRMFVALASSLTAGYLTPMVLTVVPTLAESLHLGAAFAIGAGAQRVLRSAIDRVAAAEQRANQAGEGEP